MPKTFKFFKWSGKKAVAFLILTIVLVAFIVGTTLAIIIDKTGSITNTFPAPNTQITINGNNISNTGDIYVYARAAVIITWVNETDGTTLSTVPVEGSDYDIAFNTEANWVKGSDGFWYHTFALAPAGSANSAAPALISNITQKSSKEGYKLYVQVLSSAIQATPAEAVTGSWTAVVGVNADGTLNIQ